MLLKGIRVSYPELFTCLNTFSNEIFLISSVDDFCKQGGALTKMTMWLLLTTLLPEIFNLLDNVCPLLDEECEELSHCSSLILIELCFLILRI